MAGRAGGAPREYNMQDRDIDCRVHVFGYPGYTQPQDLSRAFVHLGGARVERMGHDHAALVFPSPADARAALEATKKVSIYGTLLTVKPYNPSLLPDVKRSPKKEKKKQPISPTIDPHDINLSGDFHQQLDNILARVRLTQEEVAAISTLYSDLEEALQTIWPGCTAVPFGSIPTGLGVKSSDADCFVRLAGGAGGGAGGGAEAVVRARRVLAARGSLFTDVLAIPRASTPIVKLRHRRTGTACDLTFKTELGARNSRLVGALLRADRRALPAAVAAKYWARTHQLSGSGRLTNYALTTLLLAYLQRRRALPPVRALQAAVPEDVVDHWNVAFDDRPESLPPNADDAPISEVIGGFFQYYAAFDFDKLVVCPYLGHPIEKEAFQDLDNLPEGFERYKANVSNRSVLPLRFNTSICVQDPFEQCHNIASTISSRLAEELKAYFKFAANAYEQEKPKNCKRFFEIILLQKPKIIRNKGNPEFRANLFPNMIANIVAPDWKAVVRKVVLEIFETMLKIKLGKVEEKVNPDSRKEKEKYMGTVPKPIWKRKQFNKLYSVMNLDLVQRNKRITEEILATEREQVNIQFQLTVTFCHEPRSSVVAVKMSSGDVTAFREFGKFFVSVLPGWFSLLARPPDGRYVDGVARGGLDADVAPSP